jgi:hypothetical protein
MSPGELRAYKSDIPPENSDGHSYLVYVPYGYSPYVLGENE